MSNIYLFGECMIELMASSQQRSSTRFSKTMQQSFAGDVFNTAVYLKRLFEHAKVNLVTAIGQDRFSDDMLSYFEDEGLGTDCVFRSPDKMPGLYAIQLDDYGERSFNYWRNDSAARTVMSFIDEQVTEQLCSGDLFFFSGISLGVIAPKDREKFWQFIASLKAAGVSIGFDLNYRPKLWMSKAEAKEQFLLAFEGADILLPGVDDFAALFDLDNVDSIIEFFAPYDYQELIIKNGERNVYCLSSCGTDIVAVTPAKCVVDTTSAGDSFNGAYIGSRMAGRTIRESVDLANQVAGFVIQHPGAIVDKSAFSSRFK